MDVKSVEIKDAGTRGTYGKVGVLREHGTPYFFDGGLKSRLGITPGKTYTLIAVEHPDPPKPEPERKECAKVSGLRSSGAYMWFACCNCGAGLGCESEQCPVCAFDLTDSITWAEFTRRDC